VIKSPSSHREREKRARLRGVLRAINAPDHFTLLLELCATARSSAAMGRTADSEFRGKRRAGNLCKSRAKTANKLIFAAASGAASQRARTPLSAKNKRAGTLDAPPVGRGHPGKTRERSVTTGNSRPCRGHGKERACVGKLHQEIGAFRRKVAKSHKALQE